MNWTLGPRILALLAVSGMSRKTLGEKIGVSESAISHYIKGVREPKLEALMKMAQALGTTTDYLIGGEEVKGREKQNFDDFNYRRIRRIIADNAEELTEAQKKGLLKAIFA